MTLQIRSVAVKQLPEAVSGKQRGAFLKDMEACLLVDRPRIVLDCSSVQELDKATIHAMLCCLEEAMKRNGDVRLAALPEQSRDVFEAVGLDRLFEVFETPTDAVSSFYRHTRHAKERAAEVAENAA